MNKQPEQKPVSVPLAQQAGDVTSRWRWVAPSAWTIRMLEALEQGVKGTKWFRLIDKVFSERNLLAAFQQVAKNDGAAGVDHVTTDEFERLLPDSIWELSDLIKSWTFKPQAIKRVEIPKPGSTEKRPLGIPTVRDRVVQAAIVNVIEPIFERDFAEHSYGFRPGRGCKDGLRRVDELIKSGHVFVVDADLKGYFDTIPHDQLMERVREKIADGPVLKLIESFLKADIMSESARWTPERGAPQGAVLSPLLSNIYLDPLDHLVAASGFQMVRYADDFVILCRTMEEAQRALDLVRTWTEAAGLTLHPTKTKLVDSRTDGFSFLGYTFRGTKHWPRDKSRQKLKDSLREKTKRTSGESLACIIQKVNQSLRGWFEYFQHSSYANVFTDEDGWVRRRLRSLLRKRSKRRGISKGRDHQRWPNQFFAKHGLFSLKQAYAAVLQPSQR